LCHLDTTLIRHDIHIDGHLSEWQQVMHQKIKHIDRENFEINSEAGKFKTLFGRTATSKYTSAFVTFRYEADYELVRDENPKP
jgi:hypothetical protein